MWSNKLAWKKMLVGHVPPLAGIGETNTKLRGNFVVAAEQSDFSC